VVSVNWQSGTVSTALLGPSGRLITAATQASDVTHDGDSTWQYYLVSFPETGVWTFASTGVSVEVGGEKASINAEASPTIPPMVLAFPNPSAGSAPLTVTFTASASDLEGGPITSYAWQYGDGTTGAGATSTHTYAVCGTYVATVTATSSEGLQGSSTTVQIAVGAEQKP
jgi:PKD repeat protein